MLKLYKFLKNLSPIIKLENDLNALYFPIWNKKTAPIYDIP